MLEMFQKEPRLGTPFEYTEIEIQKRPLNRQLVLFMQYKRMEFKKWINVVEKIGDIGHLLEINFEWMEGHTPLIGIIAAKVQGLHKEKLDSFCSQMSKDDIDKLQSLDMFPDN